MMKNTTLILCGLAFALGLQSLHAAKRPNILLCISADKAYAATKHIDFEGMHYRKDIGEGF